MRLRSSSVSAGSIVLAGLFAGCGSSSPSAGTEGTTEAGGGTTMSRYIAAADALCAAENERLAGPGEELESALREAEKSGELAAAARPVREFGTEVKRGLARLESLQSPAARRGEVEAVIATEAGQVDLFGELAGAFESDDRTAAQKVETRLVNTKKRYGAQTAKLGFKVCGLRSR
jgi:hypothetical protein